MGEGSERKREEEIDEGAGKMISIALLFAFLSSFLWALVNVFDKYLVSHKVKYPFGFSILAGIFYLITGAFISLLLDWIDITFQSSLFPLLAGLLLGVQLYFYYFVAKSADVSYVLGIYYIYPLLVTLLSFLFLNEVISFVGYLGAGFAVLGAVLMSVRVRRMKFTLSFFMIGAMIITGALSEFFVKVATNNLSLWHGVALNNIGMGLAVLPLLFYGVKRRQFLYEVKNVRFVFMSEIPTFFAILFLYLAMQGLPATIVTSIGTMQPVLVVLFEKAAHTLFGKMIRDKAFQFKLGAIILVAIGIVLLTIAS